ncbi:unnamed protein product [Vitrella brassicaformis CCMP3155]|uniref:Uncharacterized protein n=1 Tax=Vitrella brassicaformis (strain CCMP3155) TaxID=1169540 RepID=A0A0G4EE19_VITBC|nr:unnamed protein product [Vitrella brassicaformis CCMP3155]|eukprot:CEL93603.1 unnamed protein product [Vitrella brassicaformis CCMP3155]
MACHQGRAPSYTTFADGEFGVWDASDLDGVFMTAGTDNYASTVAVTKLFFDGIAEGNFKPTGAHVLFPSIIWAEMKDQFNLDRVEGTLPLTVAGSGGSPVAKISPRLSWVPSCVLVQEVKSKLLSGQLLSGEVAVQDKGHLDKVHQIVIPHGWASHELARNVLHCLHSPRFKDGEVAPLTPIRELSKYPKSMQKSIGAACAGTPSAALAGGQDGKDVRTMAGIEMARGDNIDAIMREQLDLGEEERQLARVLGTIDLLDKAIHGMHDVAVFSVCESQRRIEEAVVAAAVAGLSPTDAISPVQLAEELSRPSAFVSTDDESSSILIAFQRVVQWSSLKGAEEKVCALAYWLPAMFERYRARKDVTEVFKIDHPFLSVLMADERLKSRRSCTPKRPLDTWPAAPPRKRTTKRATALFVLFLSSGCAALDLKPLFFIRKGMMEAYQEKGE